MPALDLTTLLDGSPVNGIQTNRGFVNVCAVTSATGDPTEYIVTVKTAILANATSASLQSSADFTCEKGQTLYFGSEKIVVSATTVILAASPTTVPIYAAAAGIALNAASHPTLGMASLPVSEIGGWNRAINTVDAKTLGYGEQSQDERVSATWDLSLSLIIPPSNLAYYKHVLPSAENAQGYTGRIYVFAAVPIDNAGKFEYGVGAGLVTITGDPLPKNEIRRPQISVKMQYPYIKSTLYSLESVQRQALLVTAAKLAGEAVPT